MYVRFRVRVAGIFGESMMMIYARKDAKEAHDVVYLHSTLYRPTPQTLATTITRPAQQRKRGNRAKLQLLSMVLK